MEVEPISPKDVPGAKLSGMPDAVIQLWNGLIAREFSSGVAVVYQDEVIGALLESGVCKTRAEIFNKRYLDIEDIYKAKGWSVTYETSYYGDHPATFKFKPAG